jgi:prepilin-type N-terminal cleavage/methylation domain-containing protein
MNRRGFTLIEMMIAVVLTGIVGAAVYNTLWSNQRVYRRQTERVALQTNVRAGLGILRRELRELNSADTVQSDITVMGATAVTYKAMRTLVVLCQPPVNAGATGTLIAWRTSLRGIRAIDGSRDSVLIYAERDQAVESDDYWVHANVGAGVAMGTACPGLAASITIPVTNVWPVNGLGGVFAGAPARTFETMQLLAYSDAAGEWWLGGKSYIKVGGWSATEAILGPLSGAGLHLSYYNSAGAVTAIPEQVARIGVTIVGRSTEAVASLGGGPQAYLRDSLVTDIALRNIPRP